MAQNGFSCTDAPLCCAVILVGSNCGLDEAEIRKLKEMVDKLTDEKTRLNEKLQKLSEQKSSCSSVVAPVSSSDVLVIEFEDLQLFCDVVIC